MTKFAENDKGRPLLNQIPLGFQVDAADPPFPRPLAHWWFGCKNVPASFGSLGNVIADPEHSYSSHDDIDGDFLMDAGGEWNRQKREEHHKIEVLQRDGLVSGREFCSRDNLNFFLKLIMCSILENFHLCSCQIGCVDTFIYKKNILVYEKYLIRLLFESLLSLA